ncbi:hypothetical protein HDU88_004000 [Geranomyces variabilis]|nr:hypothetical protein HDU88_004000 [Geranomyces variabilis]
MIAPSPSWVENPSKYKKSPAGGGSMEGFRAQYRRRFVGGSGDALYEGSKRRAESAILTARQTALLRAAVELDNGGLGGGASIGELGVLGYDADYQRRNENKDGAEDWGEESRRIFANFCTSSRLPEVVTRSLAKEEKLCDKVEGYPGGKKDGGGSPEVSARPHAPANFVVKVLDVGRERGFVEPRERGVCVAEPETTVGGKVRLEAAQEV